VFGVELIEAAILDKAPEVRRAAGKVDVFRSGFLTEPPSRLVATW
jgi:hypothetical protein